MYKFFRRRSEVTRKSTYRPRTKVKTILFHKARAELYKKNSVDILRQDLLESRRDEIRAPQSDDARERRGKKVVQFGELCV